MAQYRVPDDIPAFLNAIFTRITSRMAAQNPPRTADFEASKAEVTRASELFLEPLLTVGAIMGDDLLAYRIAMASYAMIFAEEHRI